MSRGVAERERRQWQAALDARDAEIRRLEAVCDRIEEAAAARVTRVLAEAAAWQHRAIAAEGAREFDLSRRSRLDLQRQVRPQDRMAA